MLKLRNHYYNDTTFLQEDEFVFIFYDTDSPSTETIVTISLCSTLGTVDINLCDGPTYSFLPKILKCIETKYHHDYSIIKLRCRFTEENQKELLSAGYVKKHDREWLKILI